MLEPTSLDFPFKFAAKWVSRLFKKLSEKKEQRQDDLDEIGDVFGDPLQLAEYYVEPDCQQFNPADDDEDEISYVVREPIFRRLEAFFGGAKREGKHQLFILSDAGMGKTSLLVMLKLADITAFWPKGYECLLYKLGPSTLDEVSKITGRRKKILLLDALDEDPLAWGRIEERIIEILQETKTFRRVVITCRTQFFSADEDPFNRRGQVKVGGFLCPVIYNSLFSDEQMDLYLKKRFGRGRQANELIKKSRRILIQMGSLKFRPMLLAHIEDFLEAEHEDWNEYTIYNTLVEVWLLREQTKRLYQTKTKPVLEEMRQACRVLALYLQKKGKSEISESDLSALIQELPALRHVPRMDITGRSLLNKNSSGSYRFSHYTIQEFLLVNGSIHGSTNLSQHKIEPTAQMNSFIAAWLTDPRRKEDLPEDLSAYDLRGANLQGVRLIGQNLMSLNLQGANLRDADLSHSELQWAKLEDADLRGANLRSAKLHWAEFEGAKYDETTSWPVTGPADGAVRIGE